jgi:hypothetical protein
MPAPWRGQDIALRPCPPPIRENSKIAPHDRMTRGVPLDIAGMIHRRSDPIPATPETVERLLAAKLLLRFLTNQFRHPLFANTSSGLCVLWGAP